MVMMEESRMITPDEGIECIGKGLKADTKNAQVKANAVGYIG